MDACIRVETLGTLNTLAPDAPERRHVDGCPRCRALAVAYREFVGGGDVVGADPRDAEVRLAAFIAERIEAAPERPVRAGAVTRRRWFELPMLRVAFAAAAVVAVVAVVQWLPRSSRDDIVLRGDPHAILMVEVPRSLPGGTVELRWAPVANADTYQVTILTDDLVEVVRFPATNDTRMAVDPAVLPVEAGTPLRWQVTALREGGVLAESVIERIELR
jgi:hypothetical protein